MEVKIWIGDIACIRMECLCLVLGGCKEWLSIYTKQLGWYKHLGLSREIENRSGIRLYQQKRCIIQDQKQRERECRIEKHTVIHTSSFHVQKELCYTCYEMGKFEVTNRVEVSVKLALEVAETE